MGSTSVHSSATAASPCLNQPDRRTPESYENWEWIGSVYREGNRWHALIGNEFHDAVASTCRPGDPSPANPCWYNSITYAVSTDGARPVLETLRAGARRRTGAQCLGTAAAWRIAKLGLAVPRGLLRAEQASFAKATASSTESWD